MTGQADINVLLGDIVSRCETAFPGRVSSCYLFGSHVDGTAIAASDVDVLVVLRDRVTESEARTAAAMTRMFKALRPIHADVLVFGEDTLLREGHFRLETNSQLVVGADIRA